MTDAELITHLTRAWSCSIHDFEGEFAPVDSYVVREGRQVAYVERKTRGHTYGTYTTALVDARKWLALLAAEFATGLPAILAIGYECGTVIQIRPATRPEISVDISTPGPESVSLNRGVARPVVYVPLADFRRVTL